jgi:hypothetical protein
MSFLQRAREAAASAADQARQAADVARLKASDPATQERVRTGMQQAGTSARQAGSAAKRGLSNMIDRIDPGVLADVVIKATAIQERANAALRQKGSPYRISEVQITATLPPQVGFAISRIGDITEALTGLELASAQLVQEVLAEEASQADADGSGLAPESGGGDDVASGDEAVVPEDQAILP